VTRDGVNFSVTTTIRNIDDAFDGKIDTTPKDLSPADYKLVEVVVGCESCRGFQPIIFSTNVAPKNLETASTNGSLFVKVFDADGHPISGANVHIENHVAIPNITVDDVTDNSGMLQIVDAPPGTEAYQITVSKNGYSTERTYPTGGGSNPFPVKPNATVILQQVTQISFAIDKVSTMNISSVTENCAPVGDVPFHLTGTKLIGTPDVKKFDHSYSTNSSGVFSLSGLEWDTYSVSITDTMNDLLGINPNFPVAIRPNSTENVQFVMAPKDPISFLVSTKDSATGLPLSGVNVELDNGGVTLSKVSGRGFLNQTDWSGGDGQDDIGSYSKFFSDDGFIDFLTIPGEIKLHYLGDGNYSSAGFLVSSTFDTGSPSNFYELSWKPTDQPVETGEESVKFQIATNLDNLTWNFVGPDGTSASYYTLANQNINAVHNGDRYFRYKVFLSTEDPAFSPSVSDVAFTFTSSCVPPGQVRFGGLSAGNYILRATKIGYQDSTDDFYLNSSQSKEIILLPE
jgi:hypothetical protein